MEFNIWPESYKVDERIIDEKKKSIEVEVFLMVLLIVFDNLEVFNCYY